MPKTNEKEKPTMLCCGCCVNCTTEAEPGRDQRTVNLCRGRMPEVGKQAWPKVNPISDFCAEGVLPDGTEFSVLAMDENRGAILMAKERAEQIKAWKEEHGSE